MNDPGIEKIYYIKKSKASFPAILPPGSVIDISPYLTDSLTELEFDKATFRINSVTEKTAAGKLVKTTAQFTISGISNTTETLLNALEDEPHIFVFGDIEDQFMLMGTNYYKPEFFKNLIHEDPPSSKKKYQVTINLVSTFGLIFCTIP